MSFEKGGKISALAAAFMAALVALSPSESEGARDMRAAPNAQSENQVQPGIRFPEVRDFYRSEQYRFWRYLQSFPLNVQLGERLRKLPRGDQQALQRALEAFIGNAVMRKESGVEALRDLPSLRSAVEPYMRMRGLNEEELRNIDEVLEFIANAAKRWLQPEDPRENEGESR